MARRSRALLGQLWCTHFYLWIADCKNQTLSLPPPPISFITAQHLFQRSWHSEFAYLKLVYQQWMALGYQFVGQIFSAMFQHHPQMLSRLHWQNFEEIGSALKRKSLELVRSVQTSETVTTTGTTVQHWPWIFCSSLSCILIWFSSMFRIHHSNLQHYPYKTHMNQALRERSHVNVTNSLNQYAPCVGWHVGKAGRLSCKMRSPWKHCVQSLINIFFFKLIWNADVWDLFYWLWSQSYLTPEPIVSHLNSF